jgi:hypothetical protein
MGFRQKEFTIDFTAQIKKEALIIIRFEFFFCGCDFE